MTDKGAVWAYMTGERSTEESRESGSTEEYGFVDTTWDRRVLFVSRNDVRPLFGPNFFDDDLADQVKEALEELGSYEPNGDGLFYGQDSETDPDTGDDFTYAVYFVRKFQNDQGVYVEESFDPFE